MKGRTNAAAWRGRVMVETAAMAGDGAQDVPPMARVGGKDEEHG